MSGLDRLDKLFAIGAYLFPKIPFWISLIALISACGPALTTVPEATTPAATPTAESFLTAVPPNTAINSDTIEAVERLYTLTAHTDRVTDVAFSPDGAYLASSGRDGKIRLWDTQSWQEVQAFDIDLSDLNVIAFSPSGNLIASSETIWDVASRQVIHKIEEPGEGGHVAFSPDGSMLAVAGFPATVKLWDVESGETLARLRHADELMDVDFSPDGTLLATGGYDNTIVIWGIPR